MSNQTAGWGKSPASRKWHYFPAGDSFSLCRRIGFYFGERDDSDDTNADNCAACKKLVVKHRTAAATSAANATPND